MAFGSAACAWMGSIVAVANNAMIGTYLAGGFDGRHLLHAKLVAAGEIVDAESAL